MGNPKYSCESPCNASLGTEGKQSQAIDSYLIGVDPDLGIHVSRNVFDADDGPLLAILHGLDGNSLRVPDEPLARPDPAFLEWRFDRFEAVQT